MSLRKFSFMNFHCPRWVVMVVLVRLSNYLACAGGQALQAARKDKDLTPARARRTMRHQKKKGETAVWPQIHPRVIIAELKYFASANFKKFYVPGRGNAKHASSCSAAHTSLNWIHASRELPNSRPDHPPCHGARAHGRRHGHALPPRHSRPGRL